MRVLLGFLAALALACVGPSDNVSTVRDLRVLGLRFDAPEVMAETCPFDGSGAADLAALEQYAATQVRLTALVVDPAGAGRALDYELAACASIDDEGCEVASQRAVLASGRTEPGANVRELVFELKPAEARLADGSLLLLAAYQEDDYKGFGGLRLPVVLRVRAGGEDVLARKLMVFNCKLVPGMEANVQPELPGLTLEGESWLPEVPRTLEGLGPFEVRAEDFSAREEAYVVPGFDLAPVHLTESWELAWYTEAGEFSPTETGGTNLGGAVERARSEWSPPDERADQDVRFWVVVRDGRGGLSWLSRTLHSVR